MESTSTTRRLFGQNSSHNTSQITSHSKNSNPQGANRSFKTKMCKFGSRCNRGDACNFAHNEEELQSRNQNSRTKNTNRNATKRTNNPPPKNENAFDMEEELMKQAISKYHEDGSSIIYSMNEIKIDEQEH